MNSVSKHISELQNFLTLWLGQSLSSLGTTMTSFAITIWAFERTGSALVLSISAVLIMVPRMITGLMIGPFVDRKNKKQIMIYADIGTGICTLVLFLLLRFETLEIWHIFSLNIITSILSSFQSLAGNVAVSAIIPKKYYVRANGLQSLSGGMIQVIAPALAVVLLSFLGISGVILIDLITMTIACLSLIFFVKIPNINKESKDKFNARNYFGELFDGFKAVRASALLCRLMLLMILVNVVSSMASFGLLSPMILARSENNEVALAVVNSSLGIGGIVGALLIFAIPARTRKSRIIFLCCLLSFIFGDMLFALSNTLIFWAIAGFMSSVFIPAINANETYYWRTIIPLELQGRAFAVKYAVQSGAIPIGMLAGGLLADYVFEPFMEQPLPLLSNIFGVGNGTGMALIFFISGVIGVALSIAGIFNRSLKRAEIEVERSHSK